MTYSFKSKVYKIKSKIKNKLPIKAKLHFLNNSKIASILSNKLKLSNNSIKKQKVTTSIKIRQFNKNFTNPAINKNHIH